jgi:hypothetical protein
MQPTPGCAATQQLSCSPPLIRFGQVPVGTSVSQPVVLTNSGSTSATISGISVNDAVFQVSGINLPAVLAPGQSVTLQVSFVPSEDAYSGAKITFTSNLSYPRLLLPVNGLGTKRQVVSAAPSLLSFGDVKVGTSASLSVVVSCTSCGLPITALLVEGSAFSVSGPTLPTTINPKNSVTLQVTFKPVAAGLTAGNVLVRGLGLNIPFTGTGSGTGLNTGKLNITPSSLGFGNVDIGGTSAQSSTLTAIGGSVTVSSASSSNSEFSIPGSSFPLTIPAGQSAEVQVVFSPTKAGGASGSLTLSSNASNSPAGESVSGTGVAAQYSVALSWNASTSPVAGYNVYRGMTVGSYTKINSSLDATTSYTDNGVVSGATYYYAATAVSANGQESSYSSPLKVAIP